MIEKVIVLSENEARVLFALINESIDKIRKVSFKRFVIDKAHDKKEFEFVHDNLLTVKDKISEVFTEVD